VLVLGLLTGGKELAAPAGGAAVTDAEARAIIRTHCSACHSDTPTHADITEAPKGLMYDKMEEIRRNAPRIYEQAVEHETMPLGNQTKMTPEERAKLGAWIRAIEKK